MGSGRVRKPVGLIKKVLFQLEKELTDKFCQKIRNNKELVGIQTALRRWNEQRLRDKLSYQKILRSSVSP